MEGVFLKAALKTDCWIHRKIRRYSEGLDENQSVTFFNGILVCLCLLVLFLAVGGLLPSGMNTNI